MNESRVTWSKYSAPQTLYPLAGALIPWCAGVAIVFMVAGLYLGFFVAPTDFQQGEAYRIIFVHVPAAWMSMLLYVVMAAWAGLGLGLKARPSFMMAQAIAPTGALFTFLALLTGALWGKPTWGAWWVWDARLTSELILLFLYVGYIALQGAIEDRRMAARAGAVLATIGLINIPIIHFSVQWWSTLHQGPTITRFDAPAIHITMLIPLLIMALGFKLYYAAVVLVRMRCELLEAERNSAWVRQLGK